MELDAFVDRFATRVASFDRAAIAAAKRILREQAGVARPEELARTQDQFFGLLQQPEAQRRVGSLFEQGLQQRDGIELDLGERLAPAPLAVT